MNDVKTKKLISMGRMSLLILLLFMFTMTGCGKQTMSREDDSTLNSEFVEQTSIGISVEQTTNQTQDTTEETSEQMSGSEEIEQNIFDWEEIFARSADNLPDREKVEATIPEEVDVFDWVQGDIGLDGKEDIVIIYNYPDEEYSWCMQRKIAVFTKRDEMYECIAFHESLLPDNLSGGTMGDPYNYTKIEEETGNLIFSVYGGSSGRWGYSTTFAMEDGKLVLRECSHTNHYIWAIGSIERVCNYQTQNTKCYGSWYLHDEDYEKLLYSYDWLEEEEVPTFVEVSDIFIADSAPDMDIAIPSLSDYSSATQAREQGVDFSASNILDEFKEAYDPDMKKVMYDTEMVFVDNISMFVGYEIPPYYYENSEGHKFCYFSGEYHEDSGEWTHQIGVRGITDRYYRIIDYPLEQKNIDKQ